jgi:DMSO/TMAO reductase YedYZ heme-binding membrane subunit
MTALVTSVVVIVFALVMTKPGQDIDAATQHFMLYYAGVFALIGLTASVGVGLMATDRILMTPGHRVMAQAVHRAVSFGALAFLVIHIVTEILAQRAHVIDAFIPFLSPYRTFYIGLGTIASDLILLIIVTSIVRKRFTAHGKAWRWRAIHYSAYLAFVFGVLHGLLGGRAAKPYVDWSYGFAIALTALALVVRFLAISLRSKDRVSAPAGADRATGGLGYSKTSSLRAAALSMSQAQLGGTIQMLPTSVAAQSAGVALPGSQAWAALPPGPDWRTASGPLPALSAAPAYAADPALMPLGAPVYGETMTAGTGGYSYPAGPERQPLYEPGYDGPPRFAGAPRTHVPQDDLSSYPYPAQNHAPTRGDRGSGPLPRLSPPPGTGSGPMPRVDTGPMPRANTGPMPRLGTGPAPRADSGPMPRASTGPMPRIGTGPMPRADSGPAPRTDSGPLPRLGTGPAPRTDSGPMPRLAAGPVPRPDTGPMPRLDTGPMPRANTGPMPRLGTGPIPRADSGPMPRLGTGPMPRTDSGPMPRLGTGPALRADSGPLPRLGTGPAPRTDSGPMPRLAAGPVPRPDTGPMPRVDTGPMPRIDTGPMPRPGTGRMPRTDTGPMPRPGTGRMPRTDSGPMPRMGTGPMPPADSGPGSWPGPGPMHGADSGSIPRTGTGPAPRPGSGSNPRPSAGPRPRANTGSGPGPTSSPDSPHVARTGSMPATATRRSRRAHAADPRRHDVPGRDDGGDEWR